ncbi:MULTISPECIES: hypothetical protein [Halomicrobium]|uniref:Uncharacterized protein n=2 Tax=Halomicrobium mukohataei TaxID=57705 RepID=C7NYC9_HALMD|nr:MULTISPECIES: hypothetical protein [Halomicrobium]ACV46590.1 conserved hypothetical protein [Halomicrobium mukohataei DSM 12286]QCD65130.1 hypothetical protein E5139_05540 [Halomicrobium mukohataei]QFR19936.1 hypothetical protein GBQ70_05535 [Halomicrobium sp. ZPS1]
MILVRLDTLLGYGLLGTIGVSASTIAAAVVGQPFPVVVPTIFAAAVVAAHHVRTKDSDPSDDQLDDATGDAPAVATDGGRQ